MVDYCCFNWPFSHSTHFHLSIDLYLMYVRCQFCVLYSYPSKPSRLYKWLFKSISNFVPSILSQLNKMWQYLNILFLMTCRSNSCYFSTLMTLMYHWRFLLYFVFSTKRLLNPSIIRWNITPFPLNTLYQFIYLLFFFLSNPFAIFFMSMLTSVLIEASNRSSE